MYLIADIAITVNPSVTESHWQNSISFFVVILVLAVTVLEKEILLYLSGITNTVNLYLLNKNIIHHKLYYLNTTSNHKS